MNLAVAERYILSDEFEQLASRVDFPAEIWNVAAQLTEARTSNELAQRTGISPAKVNEALHRLLENGLIRIQALSWQDFVSSQKTEVPAQVAAAPAEEIYRLENSQEDQLAVRSAINQQLPQPSVGHGIFYRIGHIYLVKPSPDALVMQFGQISGLTPIHKRMLIPPVKSHTITEIVPIINKPQERFFEQPIIGVPLRPLLKKIESFGNDEVAGQLIIYQVFLRVPIKLLKAEGIRSLRIFDDSIVIRSEALYQAIAQAAKDITGIVLPDFPAISDSSSQVDRTM